MKQKGILLESYNPKPGEIIVFKFDMSLNVQQVHAMFKMINNSFLDNKVIGIPDNTVLEVLDKKDVIKFLNETIKFLEE